MTIFIEILTKISDFIINGFIITTIFLSLTYWFLKMHRLTLRKINTISNLYLLIGSLVFLAQTSFEISHEYIVNNDYNKYVLSNRLFGPYCIAFWVPIIFQGFLPQILWIKKIRQNLIASNALVPFLLSAKYMPMINSYQSEYLPSGWALNFNFAGLILDFILFGILITITFVLMRKKS